MTKKETEYLINLFTIAEKWILAASQAEDPAAGQIGYRMAAQLLEGTRQNLINEGSCIVKKKDDPMKIAEEQIERERNLAPEKKYMN